MSYVLNRISPLRWNEFEKELTRSNRNEHALESGWLDTFALVNPRSKTMMSRACSKLQSSAPLTV
jgi:hypothetical protein